METYGTLTDAREAKRAAARRDRHSKTHAADLHRDEPRVGCPECDLQRERREGDTPTLHEYAREWIGRYEVTGPAWLPRPDPGRVQGAA